MLRRTFLHLHGVGEATERRWWTEGWTDWAQYLAAAVAPGPAAMRAENRRRVEECVACWDRGAWDRLDHLLPTTAHWRAYGDFGESALYLDIETEGDAANTLTMIGLFDGHTYHPYIAGRDLDQALCQIDRHPLLVTFNGAHFDLPLLQAYFREPLNAFHVDLMYPLRRLGLKGGLKRIERVLGIVRAPEVEGLSGWDAVRLWREYRNGSAAALDRLIAYNQADTRNLKTLMEYVWNRLATDAWMSARQTESESGTASHPSRFQQ